MAIVQTRLANGHYFISERVTSTDALADGSDREIVVTKAQAPDFIRHLQIAIRKLYDLPDEASLLSATASYEQLLTRGILEIRQEALNNGAPLSPKIHSASYAFLKFASGPTPDAVKFYYCVPVGEEDSIVTVYLGHSIVNGVDFPIAVGPMPPVPPSCGPVAPWSNVNPPVRLDSEKATFPSGTSCFTSGRNSHSIVVFPDLLDGYVDFPDVMPVNTDLNVKIFWASTIALGDVNWEVTFERDNAGGPFDLDADSFSITKTQLATCPAISGQLAETIIPFSIADMGNILQGEPYRVRIRRQGGVLPDTMAGDAQLFRVSMEAM